MEPFIVGFADGFQFIVSPCMSSVGFPSMLEGSYYRFLPLILWAWWVKKQDNSKNMSECKQSGPNFMALLTAEFCACHHQSPNTVQAPNYCTSRASEECLVTWSTHAHKQTFPAKQWNTLDVSKEFTASVSADSLLIVSRAMKFGQLGWVGEVVSFLAFHLQDPQFKSH